MIGAIGGDMIGAPYEGAGIKRKDFAFVVAGFTDDTVLTVAVADAILSRGGFARSLRHYARRYPDRGYGGSFRQWMATPGDKPYGSFGNGSAMRVSPVGFAFDTVEDVLLHAKRSAEVTHSHPEGIKGAQAAALAVFLARSGAGRQDIRREIARRFGYRLDRRLDDIREDYGFDVTCQGSVPEAIVAFLESDGVEDAIRNAVSLGGDADTQACIAGAIAEAFYGGVPEPIEAAVRERLPEEFLAVIDAFYARYPRNAPARR